MKMFYDVDIVNLSDSELLDRQRVAALCEYDRYLRDYNRELEPTLWFEDGTCFTTWFRGDVNEFFRSSFRPGGTDYDSYEDTMRRGGHRVNNTVVWMNKGRAVAEVMCTLTIRTKIKGEWFDGAVCGKMHYRAEKRDGKWGLVYFEGIYENDRLDPVFHDCSVKVPREELMQFRNNNFYQAWRQKQDQGRVLNMDDWAGPDRPDTLQRLYQESSRWFYGEDSE
ncbi:MAG: hypothetical protein LUG54_01750 [Clostridiales bacterium]|nr:hypothetical protein [Clostridiales bacterium]